MSPTACDKSWTLPLPLELREQIYDYIIPGDQRKLCSGHFRDHCDDTRGRRYRDGGTYQPSCNICDMYNIIYCNRQIHQEVCNLLSRRPLHFIVSDKYGTIKSTISCVSIFKFLAPRIVKVDVTPCRLWYPTLWPSLLSLCQFLRKSSYSTNLQVRCEATSPRTKTPHSITDADLARAKQETVLLLQPFNLVHTFEHVEIFILGGPQNYPWSNDIALQEFAARLATRVEAHTPVQMEHIMALPFLTRILTDQRRQAHRDRLYSDENIYATFLRGSQLRKLSDLSKEKRNDNKNQFTLPSTCTVCNKTFGSRSRLFIHLRDFHATPEVVRLSPKAQARRDQAVRRLHDVGIL